MRKVATLLVVVLAAFVASTRVSVRAQSDAKPLAFEVASIKPNNSGPGPLGIEVQPGGRFIASNVTLRRLVLDAYQLQTFQLSGGPSWLGSDHFDVVAKSGIDISDAFTAERRPGPSTLQLMVRTLLADRFKLTAHTESRELPVYALAMARSDGRIGPKLVRSGADCAASIVDRSGNRSSPCSINFAPGRLVAGTVTVYQFANGLAGFLGRAVLDHTGLSGTFDLDLTWAPDQVPQRPVGTSDPPAVDPNGPAIFTAVQEQLGLKLESTTGPVDVLVIDHVEHPTED
jgi:uncharacterized protein (TIGR03435 family)